MPEKVFDMRTRLLAFFLFALLGAALAICVVWFNSVFSTKPPHSQVTRENFDKIKKGMLRTEEELLFGKRPERGGGTFGQWTSEFGQARIWFDEERKVESGTWWEPDERGNPDDPWKPRELIEDRKPQKLPNGYDNGNHLKWGTRGQ